MNLRCISALILMLSICILLTARAASAEPLGSAFTCQGQLRENRIAFNGPADLEFTLWDPAADGAPIGPPATHSAVDITACVSTVEFDLGVNALNDDKRRIEITVTTSTTSPRFRTKTN